MTISALPLRSTEREGGVAVGLGVAVERGIAVGIGVDVGRGIAVGIDVAVGARATAGLGMAAPPSASTTPAVTLGACIFVGAVMGAAVTGTGVRVGKAATSREPSSSPPPYALTTKTINTTTDRPTASTVAALPSVPVRPSSRDVVLRDVVDREAGLLVRGLSL